MVEVEFGCGQHWMRNAASIIAYCVRIVIPRMLRYRHLSPNHITANIHLTCGIWAERSTGWTNRHLNIWYTSQKRTETSEMSATQKAREASEHNPNRALMFVSSAAAHRWNLFHVRLLGFPERWHIKCSQTLEIRWQTHARIDYRLRWQNAK